MVVVVSCLGVDVRVYSGIGATAFRRAVVVMSNVVTMSVGNEVLRCYMGG